MKINRSGLVVGCLVLLQSLACQSSSFCQEKNEAESKEAIVTEAIKNQSENVKPDCENCKDGKCENCQAGECKDSKAAAEVSIKADAKKETKAFVSTHKQSSILTPKIAGKNANLSTFRIDSNGRLVACVTPVNSPRGRSAKKPKGEDVELPAGYIQVYSPELELVGEYGVPFRPNALDIDKSGNYFIGGSGRVCKMTPDGEVELISDSPNLMNVDLDELKKEALAAAKERQKQLQDVYGRQIESLQEQIDKIEETDEDERTKPQKSQLRLYKKQLTSFKRILESNTKGVDEKTLERRLKSSSTVTAMAVTESDVYVATRARSGSGYEVYRTALDFQEPVRILKKLRGCCGQMDIHAFGDQVFVAENTKFKVGIYDREGKNVSSFGTRLKKDNQGFGSCCNPMNVLCCPNGDILTAESSVGKIKRFNADGEMTGYVGRARIGGGCKHVSIGFDEGRDRYYVQYEDKNQICVLTPKTSEEAPKNPKIAEFSERLTAGKWQLATIKENEPKQEKLAGIGIALAINDDGDPIVSDFVSGSPAKKRINVGDAIIGVGGSDGIKETSGLDVQDVAELIRGEAGSRVMLQVRSKESGKVRHRSFKRVRLEMVDGTWQVAEEEPVVQSFDPDSFSKMKSLTFKTDGSVTTEMESASPFGGGGPSHWLATKVDGETLFVDIEDSEDVITYRVKVKFTGKDSADISVTYDGIGDEGEFRGYRLIELANTSDSTFTGNASKSGK